MSYYQFNQNPFLRSCNDEEFENNSFFHSYNNNYDNNIFEPVDAQKHDDLIDPQSFSYNNCNYGFQKEENNIFEDFQKNSKENNQTFKKSIGNKSTGLSEINDKKVKFLTFKRCLAKNSKPENTNNRVHSWDDPDNIKRILQVHYLTFLIDFANDITKGVLFNEENNIKFFQIEYEIKKKLSNHKIFIGLKYKDIFELSLSPKNNGNINRYGNNHKTYLFVCKKSSLLEEFFEKSYLEIFKDYYFQDKRIINFNGLEILLSEETKTFNDLLNKGRNKLSEDVFNLIIDDLYLKN